MTQTVTKPTAAKTIATPLPLAEVGAPTANDSSDAVQAQLDRIRTIRQSRDIAATASTDQDQIDTLRNIVSALMVRVTDLEKRVVATEGFKTRIDEIDRDLYDIYEHHLGRSRTAPLPSVAEIVTWTKLREALGKL